MAGEIQIMIPQYGELNRIYSDFIVSHTFSFDRQKFITDFYKQYNDTKAFEAAILELVLDKPKEQYTLILNSLRTEIEKNILIYEKHPLFDDEIISRVCYNFAGRYDADIEAQLRVTQNLSKPLNEAYNKYDSIGYREHTAAEEKQAEKEYERCKAEYEKEKEGLDRLYELVQASTTMAIDAMFKQMKADGVDVIGFGAGEPDFNTPDNIKAAGIAAIELVNIFIIIT